MSCRCSGCTSVGASIRRRSATTASTASSNPCNVRRPWAGVVVDVIRRDRLLKLSANPLWAWLTASAYALRCFAGSSPPHPAAPSAVATAMRTGSNLRICAQATRWPLSEEHLRDLVERRVEQLRRGHRVLELGEHDVGPAQCDHAPEAA